MSSEDDRRRARLAWPVARYALGSEPDEIAAQSQLTASERIALVWSLTLDAWAMSGQPMPTYDRAHMPGRIVRMHQRPRP